MAGKRKKTGQSFSGWGGDRKGSGRPPGAIISRHQIDKMLARAEAWANEHEGRTVDDFLLMCIYGEQGAGWKMTMRDRIAAAKIWKDYTMPRVQEKNTDAEEHPGPAIGLPPKRPDPAKIIAIDGGKK